MPPATPHLDLHQECLAKLNRALDLVLKTAETASAENNHKPVIQAAREVTRIATLIIKMTDPKAKPKTHITPISTASPFGQKSSAPPAAKSCQLDSLNNPEAVSPTPKVPSCRSESKPLSGYQPELPGTSDRGGGNGPQAGGFDRDVKTKR